jgi:ribosomal protein S18 acetylase RimI-like enzyme
MPIIRNEVPTDYVYRMDKNLRHIHLSEFGRLPPGAGRGDFVGLVSALREIGYNGSLGGNCMFVGASGHQNSPFTSSGGCTLRRIWRPSTEEVKANLATEPLTLGLAARLFYDYCMIRQAVRSDAVIAVPLILQAIGHIAFVLSGTTDGQETASILNDFFRQEDNRISYQNTLVLEEDGELVGVAIFYDGAKARELDAPLEHAAVKKSGHSNYCIPTEPEASEFYLDTLSVSPRCQGKRYGSLLIETGCDQARKLGHLRMALLVEVDNAAAKRLYERLGFRADYTKWITGQEYFHMVRSL